MKIKKLQIKNFKSLVDLELENLKPFCAFVGPNASGKSNIFEALEFMNYSIKYREEAIHFFGGLESITPHYIQSKEYEEFEINSEVEFADELYIGLDLEVTRSGKFTFYSSEVAAGGTALSSLDLRNIDKRKKFIDEWRGSGHSYDGDFEQFVDNFSRIFVGKPAINKTPTINTRLLPDASNLSQIIGVIFENEFKRNDFIEWLRILIPEFENIEVRKSNIDGGYDFFVYEKGSKKPFSRNLISDGTLNILALMAAVYQGTQPQFLCVEEPENGLHPQAIELLVDFFREKCEEDGHQIWLNTHSQTLVRHLEIEEVILVNKVNGSTQAKQMTKQYNVDIRTDEAWLTNALGGGVL